MAENSKDFTENLAEPAGFAPAESVGHALLLDAAKAGGIDRDRVRELLWLINAPPDLSDMADVLTCLADVLAGAEAQWPGILELQQLEWLPRLIGELLRGIVHTRESLQASARHSNGRWLDRNGLYSALRESPSWSRELLARYRLLQAHYFFAHTAWLVRNENHALSPTSIAAYEAYGGAGPWPVLKFDPYYASLCIRDMTDEKAFTWATEYLNKLPVTLSPRQLPARSAVQMVSRTKKYNVQKKVNYVSDYLGQVYGIKERRAGRGSSPGPRVHSEIGDPDDPWLNFGYLSDWDLETWFACDAPPLVLPPVFPAAIIAIGSESPAGPDGSNSSSEEDKESKEDEQVPSDENFDEDEDEIFGGSLEIDDPQYANSPGSFAGRANGTIHQIIRQQKMFPFGIERLNAGELIKFSPYGYFELEALLEGILRARNNETVCKGDERFGLSRIDEAEAWLFLMVMFWTGSDPERAAALTVAKSKNYLHDEPLAIVIPNDFGSGSTIRVRVPFPSYRTAQAPAPGSDCVRTEYVFLNDWCLGRLVALYRRIRKLKGDRYRLFTRSIEHYKEHARALLKAWDPTGRLTLNKVSWVLIRRVMDLTGNDAVAATMITGVRHRLSRTAMYYACRELSVIQDIHRKTISCLNRDLYDAGSSVQNRLLENNHRDPPGGFIRSAPKTPDTAFLGSRLCPQLIRFRQAFRDLIGNLKQRPYRSSSDHVAWIKYHNLYTFYTVWVFAMATGVRKIVTPYLSRAEVSPLNHVARLRDKDSDSGLKAKLVWIPDPVLKQMEYYAAHQSYIRDRFAIAEDNLPCFFLSERGRTKLVRPASMFHYVHEYLPGFPVDIHRRFTFNQLLDFGCPPEVARIWMGHAVAGEEWWSEHATFVHEHYRTQLGKYLVPILNFLELRPIEGAPSRIRERWEVGSCA
jgi:hypothetical protein